MWILFAVGSAFFAGATSVLAKAGIKSVSSDFATAFRTGVVLIFSWLMVFVVGCQNAVSTITPRALVFLTLSGAATGLSWLCYFKALSIGNLSKVVAVDKSSTFLTILLALIFLGVFLFIMKRTRLGLEVRAVTQNPKMAASMGINPERINMMTFALGSGIAGIAGVAIGLFAKVTSELGQDYIVQSFMTVVVGGVGNIAGTVISALGIGLADQSLQQILLNPVLGKILVLVSIILFLQWRPAGIFVTRSRSLD